MKKIFLSLSLALCMALSLCMTCAAAPTTIREVALTMSALQVGKTLPTDIQAASPAGVTVTDFQWYGEGGKLGSQTRAEYGKSYVISFTVSVNEGVDAEFARSNVLHVTVNGEKTLYRKWDSRSFQYSANFFFEEPKEALPEVTAQAAESYDTFDYRAYANIYPDLKAAYGYDARKLYAHYVNYGRAEGRIGSFISGSNPKIGAPITAPKADPRFATLLNPLPPTDLNKQPGWAENECASVQEMSNVRLVAEYWFTKAYMDEARALREARVYQGAAFNEKENWTHLTVLGGVDAVAEELQERYEAVAENDPNYASPRGDVYGRAMQSDTTILFQVFSGYKDFAAPPADPGAAGSPVQ